jgi:hypothetical protein
MKSNNAPNTSALARHVDHRYLHIGGAFAVGGAFTRVGSEKVFVPIPTVASVELPLTGGLSIAKVPRFSLNASKVRFGPMGRGALAKLRRTQLLSVGAAAVTCNSKHVPPNQPKGSSVSVDVKGVQVEGGFSLKRAVLNLQSDHAPNDPFPSITFGPTSIVGLMLGKRKITVELDLEAFNSFPTLDGLERALQNGDQRISSQVANSFLRNSNGSLHRNQAGYTFGSIVKSIKGIPPDCTIEDNGYTIVWPGFGKVILGEILVGAFVRRVVLVRLKHCDIEIGGGCDGGSTWP